MAPLIYDHIVREKNGQTLNITIQQVTPELVEPVVQHMLNNFIKNEPLCKCLDYMNDVESLTSFSSVWREIMGSGASIVALLNKGNDQEPFVVGTNITGISRRSDPPIPFLPGEAYNYALDAIMQILKEADIWGKFDVDSYLSAVGLSVDKDYQGIGLADAILKAREKVCKEFDLPMTVTVFSAPKARHLAIKNGFETIVEYPFNNFKWDEKEKFKDLEGSMSVMVKRYDSK